MMKTSLNSRTPSNLMKPMLFCTQAKMASNSLVRLRMGLSLVVTRGYVIAGNDLSGIDLHGGQSKFDQILKTLLLR